MILDKIISALALVAVLTLVLPNFIRTNTNKKIFLKNLSIWGIIVIFLMIILNLSF